MGTKAVVAITESSGDDPVLLYRHWDAVPRYVGPALDRLCEWIRAHRIANDTDGVAGWLVHLGHKEAVTQMHAAQDGSRNKDAVKKYANQEPVEELRDGGLCGVYRPCGRSMIVPSLSCIYVVNADHGAWRTIPRQTLNEVRQPERSIEGLAVALRSAALGVISETHLAIAREDPWAESNPFVDSGDSHDSESAPPPG